MTSDELQQRISNHNLFLVVVGIILVPTSVGLWYVSFWIVKYALLFLFGFFDWQQYAEYAAVGMMFLLAIEGVRYERERRDQISYADSKYFDNFVASSFDASDGGRFLMNEFGNPLATAFVVSRFLFLAPVSTVEIFTCFRTRWPSDEQTIDNAAALLRELRSTRKWTPVAELKNFGGGLMLLKQMKLIWTELRDGVVHVRIPPGD